MSADEPVDRHEAALLAWLQRQRAWLAFRERAGIVVERPPKDREIDELATGLSDDVTDD